MTTGSPDVGDQPVYSVDTSLGTQINRYELVAQTTAERTVGLCGTGSTARGLAMGVCNRSYPYTPQIFETATKTAKNIGPATYDTGAKRTEKIAIKENGHSWILVKIPSGGSDVSISPGMDLTPSTQSPGGVEPLPAPTMTAATDVATIIAAAAVDVANRESIVGRSRSLIHIPATGQEPSVQMTTGVATLTALTTGETSGYVFGKLRPK